MELEKLKQAARLEAQLIKLKFAASLSYEDMVMHLSHTDSHLLNGVLCRLFAEAIIASAKKQLAEVEQQIAAL